MSASSIVWRAFFAQVFAGGIVVFPCTGALAANSKVGKLDKAWDEATAKGWTIVDMKQGWKTGVSGQAMRRGG